MNSDEIMDRLYEAAAKDNELASNLLDRLEGMGRTQLAEFCLTFVADLKQLAESFN